jgi:hypothetical protein
LAARDSRIITVGSIPGGWPFIRLVESRLELDAFSRFALMNKQIMQTKTNNNKQSAEQPSPPRGFPGLMIVLLLLVVVAVLGIWWLKSRSAVVSPSVMATAAEPTNNPPVTAMADKPDFQRLRGHWERPDGGYVIEITGVDDAGKLQAAYFNPQSIHVAKAQATQEGSSIKVFIELQGVNYPGSTYTLTYDSASDQLKGIYYQALQQQNYEVFFVRLR